MKNFFSGSILFLSIFSINAQDVSNSYTTPLPYTPHSYELNQVQNFPCDQEILNEISEYELYDFNFLELYDFTNSSDQLTEFELNYGQRSYLISLQRNDLRSPNYSTSLGLSGGSEVTFERTTLSDTDYVVNTFKGFANGNTQNIVRLTIEEDFFTGYIYDSQTAEWIFFDSYNHFSKNPCGQVNPLIVYEVRDVIEGGECTTVIVENENEFQQKGLTQNCQPRVMEIATDADYKYYLNQNSNVNTANKEILSILNQVEGVYSSTFNLSFSIVHQRVWDNSNDPYTSDDAQTRLFQTRTTLENDFSNINRDLAIHFTGRHKLKNAAGVYKVLGIAYLGTICNAPSLSYAVVSNIGAGRVKTTAHEIGHTLSMLHPDDSPNTEVECNSDPGIMCSGQRGLFFNQSNIDAAFEHMQDFGACLNNIDLASGNYDDWIKTWSNDRNKKWIGPWRLHNGDQNIVGDFDNDNDEEILFVSKNGGWCTILDYSCDQGSDWHHKWSNMGNNTIHSWVIHEYDTYLEGDFNGNGISELLCISNADNWATLQEFDPYNNTWILQWSNMGNGYIHGWNIKRLTDKYIVDDFNNDGKDEVLCIGANGWAKLIGFNGSQAFTIWGNNGNGELGASIPSNSVYTYLSGDFDNNGTTDILLFSNYWVIMSDFNSTTGAWSWKWSQYGASHFANMYILPLNNEQRLFAGNFDTDNQTEVLDINNTWAATADWNGNDFQQNWNNNGFNEFSDWQLNTGYHNKYIMVKPTSFNQQQIIGIKYIDASNFWQTDYYPEVSNMYRSIEYTNKSSQISDSPNDQEFGQQGDLITIYPNPAEDAINIKIGNEVSKDNLTIKIFDTQGKIVFSKDLNENESIINITDLSSGIYTVQFISSSNLFTQQKLIVQ